MHSEFAHTDTGARIRTFQHHGAGHSSRRPGRGISITGSALAACVRSQLQREGGGAEAGGEGEGESHSAAASARSRAREGV